MSESEHLPGGSEEDMVVEAFVGRIEEIYPNIDREELRDAIHGYIRDVVGDAGEEEEESEDDEE